MPETPKSLERAVGSLEAESEGHGRDIERLTQSVDGLTTEIGGLRTDMQKIRETRARDIGFMAGVSATVSLFVGLCGLAFQYFFGGHHP